jgi:hypothetical protein
LYLGWIVDASQAQSSETSAAETVDSASAARADRVSMQKGRWAGPWLSAHLGGASCVALSIVAAEGR